MKAGQLKKKDWKMLHALLPAWKVRLPAWNMVKMEDIVVAGTLLYLVRCLGGEICHGGDMRAGQLKRKTGRCDGSFYVTST